jgi:hypothetical protein
MFLMVLSATVSGDQEQGGIRALMDQRVDEASTRRIVRSIAARLEAHDHGPESLPLWEALLQAQHYLAIRHLQGDRRHRLLQRTIDRGVEVLSRAANVRFDDFDRMIDHHLSDLPPTAVGVLFWTVASHGRLIKTRSVFSRPGAAKNFYRGLVRVVELDESYFYGAAHRALAQYQIKAPGFLYGDRKGALEHASRAVRIAPQFAANSVVLAEIALELQPKTNVLTLLRRALGSDEPVPGFEPEQRAGKARARRLLRQLP